MPYLRETLSVFRQYQDCGVALAAPEVPLSARKKLLELGRQYRFFTAASLNSAEVQTPEAPEILRNTDLLAINLDEAAALTGLSFLENDAESVFEFGGRVVAKAPTRYLRSDDSWQSG